MRRSYYTMRPMKKHRTNQPFYMLMALAAVAGLMFFMIGAEHAQPETAAGNDITGVSAGWTQRFSQWIRGDLLDPLAIMEYAFPGFTRGDTVENVNIQENGEISEEELADNQDTQVAMQLQLVDSSLPDLKPTDTGPQILIYHTHSHEAYTKESGQNYTEVSAWRTDNNDYNVAKVGDQLQYILENVYGISTLHDITDHETPKLSTAYTRSLVTLQKYVDTYDSLKLCIDLHRDAYGTKTYDPKSVTVDGVQMARVMIVIGTGEGSDGNTFKEKPDWEYNYKIAEYITDELNKINPDFARKVDVKTGRYNQHVMPGCILIEVGHNENTLDEALATMPYLAKVINQLMREGTGN